MKRTTFRVFYNIASVGIISYIVCACDATCGVWYLTQKLRAMHTCIAWDGTCSIYLHNFSGLGERPVQVNRNSPNTPPPPPYTSHTHHQWWRAPNKFDGRK